MALADEKGFAALSMRRLAKQLGVVPMALYRHFRNRGDLVDAMIDRAAREIVLPSESLDWKITLAELARAIRNAVLRHPGLTSALVLRPSLGQGAIRLGEPAYRALRAAGFADDDVVRVWNLVVMYALGFSVFEAPRRAAHGVVDAMPVDHTLDAIYATLSPEEFPHTRALTPDPEEFISDWQFEYGLIAILTGIASRLAERKQKPAGHRASRQR